jgi:hypothetical protein
MYSSFRKSEIIPQTYHPTTLARITFFKNREQLFSEGKMQGLILRSNLIILKGMSRKQQQR